MDTRGTAKLADPKLLEAIDRLFELNIGDYVALPQVGMIFRVSVIKEAITTASDSKAPRHHESNVANTSRSL